MGKSKLHTGVLCIGTAKFSLSSHNLSFDCFSTKGRAKMSQVKRKTIEHFEEFKTINFCSTVFLKNESLIRNQFRKRHWLWANIVAMFSFIVCFIRGRFEGAERFQFVAEGI